VSEGGTRHTKRRKRIRDKDGKVIGYGKAEEYSSSGTFCAGAVLLDFRSSLVIGPIGG
jgi:hypothetical protein